MTHPLVEIVEWWRPRPPLGCRAAFCSHCLCLSKHLIFENPRERWRRAVGSEDCDWARYQVCSICQVRTPHRQRDPFVDPLTAINTPIDQLWEKTVPGEHAGKSLTEIERQVMGQADQSKRRLTALIGVTFALQDRIIEWRRAMDKVVMSIVLFGSMGFLALMFRWPPGLALWLAFLMAVYFFRLRHIAGFRRYELGPAILAFCFGTGISEKEFTEYIHSRRHRLPVLSRVVRRMGLGTPRSKLEQSFPYFHLKPGIDYLAPAGVNVQGRWSLTTRSA